MKKIYAKTLNPEDFDYRVYDIEEDEGNELIVDGGRNFSDIDQKGYLKAIRKLVSAYDTFEYEYYYKKSIKDFLIDYLPKKENGKRLFPKEMGELRKLLEDYPCDNYEEKCICACLKIITGKEYKHCLLKGYAQGEVVTCYYPTNTTQKYIDYVEAWYFGTGTEIEIDETDREITNPKDIEGFTFYTASWSEKQLKAEIKKEMGYKEDNEDVEVVLWTYKSSYRIRQDEYELAA